jgi:hypothetical protein
MYAIQSFPTRTVIQEKRKRDQYQLRKSLAHGLLEKKLYQGMELQIKPPFRKFGGVPRAWSMYWGVAISDLGIDSLILEDLKEQERLN